MKQDAQLTAVEWLVEKLDQNFDYVSDTIIEQAKEMEKEQIIKAYNISWKLRDKPYATAEKYYNETFKSESFCNCPKGKGIDFDENQKSILY